MQQDEEGENNKALLVGNYQLVTSCNKLINWFRMNKRSEQHNIIYLTWNAFFVKKPQVAHVTAGKNVTHFDLDIT